MNKSVVGNVIIWGVLMNRIVGMEIRIIITKISWSIIKNIDESHTIATKLFKHFYESELYSLRHYF